MPTVLSIVLSLVGLFLIHLLLGLRRAARNVGSVWLGLRNTQLINLPVTFACSKLSGPFFFFSPLSIPGHLLSRVFRQIPYLHPGDSWALRKKYEGTGVRQTTHGELSETHSYTDFAATGRDAFSVVAFLA
jgi:hypothetical protein